MGRVWGRRDQPAFVVPDRQEVVADVKSCPSRLKTPLPRPCRYGHSFSNTERPQDVALVHFSKACSRRPARRLEDEGVESKRPCSRGDSWGSRAGQAVGTGGLHPAARRRLVGDSIVIPATGRRPDDAAARSRAYKGLLEPAVTDGVMATSTPKPPGALDRLDCVVFFEWTVWVAPILAPTRDPVAIRRRDRRRPADSRRDSASPRHRANKRRSPGPLHGAGVHRAPSRPDDATSDRRRSGGGGSNFVHCRSGPPSLLHERASQRRDRSVRSRVIFGFAVV